MIRRIAFSTAIFLLASLARSGGASAAGLSIEPGGLLLQDVPVGEARSVVESSGISFVVYNRDGILHKYHIAAFRPSETGAGRWAEGYSEIPDASWIRPVPDELIILPGASASFDVEMNVPDDARLYGRKWAVTLAVESAPTPGANVALALYPALQIETEERDRAEAQPRARVGLRVHPPVMVIRDVTPGTEVQLPAPITVENRGEETIQCTLRPLKPSSIGMRKMSGYVDLPDPSWCRPEQDRITLEPGESGSVPVTLSIPEADCHVNRSWCVALSVDTAGSGTLGAAAYPYVYIETDSEDAIPCPPKATDGARALPEDPPRGTGIDNKEDSGMPPMMGEQAASAQSGCLLLSSNILDAGDVEAGARGGAGSITVLNGYQEDVFVEVRPLVPLDGELARSVLITPGHNWLKDTGWLRTCRQGVILLAGKKAQFEIDVVSPPNPATFNFRWEGFLEISGPNGPEGLVRVRWRTTSPAAMTGPLVRAAAE